MTTSRGPTSFLLALSSLTEKEATDSSAPPSPKTQANKAYSSADEVAMDVSSMNNGDCYGDSFPGSGKLLLDRFSSAEKHVVSS